MRLMEKTMQKYVSIAKWVIIAAAFFLIAGYAGESDYQDAVREEAVYCEHVKDGSWGAYKPEIKCND